MVILLGGSEQDISMFLDTPRLRDEPRDEEGRDEGRLTGLHLRLHHRILGDVVKPSFGEVRASPKDDCGMPWADYTGVFKDVVKPSNVKHQPGLINRGKNAPALRMTVRITRTMRGQRNRDARTAKIRQEPPRYAKNRQDTPSLIRRDTPSLIHRDTLSLQRGYVTSTRLVSETMDDRV